MKQQQTQILAPDIGQKIELCLTKAASQQTQLFGMKLKKNYKLLVS